MRLLNWFRKPLPPLSDDALAFLRAYYTWVRRGAPPHPVFDRRFGLCNTAIDFYSEDFARGWAVGQELKTQFRGKCYPFGGMGRYIRDFDSATAHQNHRRLDWIKEKLNA